MPKAVVPYGSWSSPITAELLVAGSVGLGAIAICGDDVYWGEARPTEGGRNVVVRRTPEGAAHDLMPQPWSARSRVHEYGGGAWLATPGTLFFVNDRDQRIYALRPGEAPRALTAPGSRRYADAALDARRRRLIAVREEHGAAATEPENALVAVPLSSDGAEVVLASGHDFYASPRPSRDERRLAWLAWRHPAMPWDETELWLADLDDAGAPVDARRIAGGSGESVFQPSWSPGGELHFVSDRTGFWNLHRWRDGRAEPLCPMDAEFGLPQWAFGLTTYGFAGDGAIVCSYIERGEGRLARLDPATGRLERIDLPFVSFSGVRVAGSRVLFVGGATSAPAALVELDLASGAHRVLRASTTLALAPRCVSVAEPIEFPTTGGRTAYAFYYPPRSADFEAPPGELPPLRVRSHGGPTGATDGSLKLAIQYWTSRGFAVIDVNYGGSTGYGRAYRERLRGQWGVVDVDDCVAGARFLVARGLADPARLTISGSSAGGYTTLCALVFRDDFAAGASHYGIGDLAALARDTHKFESRYTDALVAPYPQSADVYRERSPLEHADRLSCPVIFFQGLEDRVVPPNQAEAMVAALRAKGLPVAYVPFAGEQHGFRRASSIQRALEAELYFLSRVLGFALAETIEPLAIESLDQSA